MRPLQGLALPAHLPPSQIVYGAKYVSFMQAFVGERGPINLGARRSSSLFQIAQHDVPFFAAVFTATGFAGFASQQKPAPGIPSRTPSTAFDAAR